MKHPERMAIEAGGDALRKLAEEQDATHAPPFRIFFSMNTGAPSSERSTGWSIPTKCCACWALLDAISCACGLRSD